MVCEKVFLEGETLFSFFEGRCCNIATTNTGLNLLRSR